MLMAALFSLAAASGCCSLKAVLGLLAAAPSLVEPVPGTQASVLAAPRSGAQARWSWPRA